MLLGMRLKEVRKSKGYTQNDLAQKIGVSKVTICGYESGKRVPSLDTFVQLLDILEVEPNYLLGRDTLIGEDISEYRIKVSREDIKILKEIRNNPIVYNRFLDNTRGIINFIERKIK